MATTAAAAAPGLRTSVDGGDANTTEMSTPEATAERVRALEEQARASEGAGNWVEAFALRFSALMIGAPDTEPGELLDKKRQLILLGNCFAVQLIQNESDDDGAVLLLRRVENLLYSSASLFPKRVFWELESILCNNFACAFKIKSRHHFALEFATKALKAETRLGRKAIGTHLNLCTLMSEMKQHNRAAVHASKALAGARALCKLLAAKQSSGKSSHADSKRRPSLVHQIEDSGPNQLLVASLFSFAAQLEHLGKLTHALARYREALVVVESLGSADVCTSPSRAQLRTAIEDLQAKVADRNKRATFAQRNIHPPGKANAKAHGKPRQPTTTAPAVTTTTILTTPSPTNHTALARRPKNNRPSRSARVSQSRIRRIYTSAPK